MLRKPICIIGAARSGTSLLGRLLSRHPAVTFWNEPKYLWRYRNPMLPHDERTADEATSHVRQYIRTRLERYVQKNDAERLVEKTPSNCFRVPFVHAVLPDPRFIHLVRDGRDAALSAWEQWSILNEAVDDPSEDGSTRRLFRNAWNRIWADDVPLMDLPFYALGFGRSLMRSAGIESASTDVNIWGPKFPGIQEATKTHDLLEVCALQWKKSVRAARQGFQSVPDDRRLDLRFRSVVQSPEDVLRSVFEFADLPECTKTIEYAKDEVHSDAADRWRNREEEKIQRVMAVAGDLIRELGTPQHKQ